MTVFLLTSTAQKWYDSGEKVRATNVLEGVVLRKKASLPIETGRDAFLYLSTAGFLYLSDIIPPTALIIKYTRCFIP